MKLLVTILLYTAIFMEAFSQELSWKQLWAFSQAFTSDEQVTNWQKKLEKDAQRLYHKRLRFKSEKAFLRHLFHFLHQKYLKTYEKNASWHHIFQNGTYNCVGGVALFAYFLEKTGFVCQIHETNNHVFLCAIGETGEVFMIETTAFFSEGLLSDNLRIEDLAYLSIISLENLVGIFYYNEAVKAYTDENFVASLSFANKAYQFYPCLRNKEIFALSKEKLEKQVVYLPK